MGHLYLNERGRIHWATNEELSRWRWARKRLHLPKRAASHPAQLWLALRQHTTCRDALKIRLNGTTLESIQPERRFAGNWSWRKLELPASSLKAGANEIVLSCDSTAMDAWTLGLEAGHREPDSYLSTDQGRNWQCGAAGLSGTMRGEYLVRLRSLAPTLRDPRPPSFTYQDPRHPRARELLAAIPASIRRIRNGWRQLLALRTWVSQSWSHQASGNVYCPWDPWTIRAWADHQPRTGQAGFTPIAMCVHFGAVMASCAAALKHFARGVAITGNFNRPEGHFMTEIWDERSGRWVLHDANLDLHYDDNEALSAVDLADRSHAGQSFVAMVRRGRGFELQSPKVLQFFEQHLASGRCFENTAIWRTNDLLSNPLSAPPSHGTVCYAETDLVWYVPRQSQSALMFPYRVANRSYFDAPPA